MRTQGIVGLTATLVTLCSPAASGGSRRGRASGETVLSDASVRISTGGGFSCQVNEDGTIRCWGANNRGQLGNGLPTDARTWFRTRQRHHHCRCRCSWRQFRVRTAGRWQGPLLGKQRERRARRRRRRAEHSAGRAGRRQWHHERGRDLGRVFPRVCTARRWHCPLLGLQFRWPDRLWQRQRRPAHAGRQSLSNAIAIAAGAFHTCALLANGAVRCWGSNTFGCSALVRSVDARSRRSRCRASTPATAIALGPSQSCALLANGTARSPLGSERRCARRWHDRGPG